MRCESVNGPTRIGVKRVFFGSLETKLAVADMEVPSLGNQTIWLTRLVPVHARREQITETNTTKKFGTHAIRYCVDDFRAVLRWINMNPERPLAEGSIDNLYDRRRDCGDICIRRHNGGKTFKCLVCQTGIRTGLIFRGAHGVRGTSSVCEV